VAKYFVNTNQPLVSIVIPVYNAGAYVHATLDSVLKQSWRELEIIVVNDGSTDRSIEICQQFDDPRICYVHQQNSGLAAARNAGIKKARGQFLGFIDADDIWLPGKVARHVEQFSHEPDLGVSYSFSSLMDEAGNDLGTFQKEGTDPTSFPDCYTRNVIGNGSNAMLRKEVFTGRDSDLQSFPPMHSFKTDLRRAEDFELWSRIACLSRWKMACIPEILVRYRINTSGLSSNTKAQRHYHLLAMAMIGQYAPYDAEKYRTTAVAHMYWHQARLLAYQKQPRAGLQAVRTALHYDWRTLSANHVMIAAALVSSALLPRSLYFIFLRLSSHAWGGCQRLAVRFENRKKDHPDFTQEPEKSMPAMIAAPGRYARKAAMTNLFFLCHKHRLMFLGIAKNASTTLKHIMYREEFGVATQDVPAAIHKAWGWGTQTGRTIDLGDAEGLQAYSGYTRFAVYRDPVARFLSTYHNKVLYSDMPHVYYVENRLEGMALDHFINVVETILKMKNPLHIDEHLRPQAWYYRPEDVDYIVPLESLPDFLQTRFGIQAGPARNKTRLPRIAANRRQLARIREIYACDYAIKPNWPVAGAKNDEQAEFDDLPNPRSP